MDLWLDEVRIVAVYATSAGPLVHGYHPDRGGGLVIREGDRFADGRFLSVTFLTPKVAVVRLKQRIWPPGGQEPYADVFRAVGWDSTLEVRKPPTAPPPGTMLWAAGQEAVGLWPKGHYVDYQTRLSWSVEGMRRPRVDLFAIYFREVTGVLPWHHKAWNNAGWEVEEGYPLHGSIVDLGEKRTPLAEPSAPKNLPDLGPDRYRADLRRDPFRSPQAPWSQRERPYRPAGVPGLLIEELELEEVYGTAEGPRAKVRTRDRFWPLILEPGDSLWDGYVAVISPTSSDWYSRCGEVIFGQAVQDEEALKPFREVIKRQPWRPGGCF